MKFYKFIVTSFLFGTFIQAVIVTPLMADDENQFVLLRSGKIIEGNPSTGRSQTRIELGKNDYIQIPNEHIEKSFRRRKDVFNYKAAVTPFKVEKQNELLQWIVQQKNFKFAQEHLQELKSNGIEMDFDGWERIIVQRGVVPKSHRSNSVSKSTPKSNTKEQFVAKVENHLVLGCAISGCHKPKTESSYLLEDLKFDQTASMKNPNFEATMNRIKEGGAGNFLKMVSGKHGGLKKGMYTSATIEYLDIATWVNGLPRTGVSIPQTAPSSIQPQISKSKKPRPASIPNYSQPARKAAKPVEYSITQEGTDEFVPVDEFDPEIFNRAQAEKWQTKTEIQQTKDVSSQVPERLIFPERTDSKK